MRQNSFFHSGGLVAVHADGPDRTSIWEALEQRRVYATTGERIELWFELVNGPDGPVQMGGLVSMDDMPRFTVRASGSFIQRPGCPDWVPSAHKRQSCHGECYNPTDRRHAMDRVEVVRIRPQVSPEEPLDELVDDPFLILDCPGPEVCEVSFEDPDFQSLGRPAIYYVRAIQEPTGQLNHEDLRCETDALGRCTSVQICQGGARGEGDDCIQDGRERAWASPITLTVE